MTFIFVVCNNTAYVTDSIEYKSKVIDRCELRISYEGDCGYYVVDTVIYDGCYLNREGSYFVVDYCILAILGVVVCI